LKKSSKLAAHDEQNQAKEGDKVQIIECAPISKNKRFTVYSGEATVEAPVEKKPAAKKAPAKKAAPKKAAAKKEDK
jgi:hypothetical protein